MDDFGPPLRIGVISDTHGLLRPSVLDIFKNVDHIIHAGDIGNPNILDELATIAPVTAVIGNTDSMITLGGLPNYKILKLSHAQIFITHGHIEPKIPDKTNIVILGHSHIPLISYQKDYIVLNPGSAGPKRFSLPSTVAKITIFNTTRSIKIIELP